MLVANARIAQPKTVTIVVRQLLVLNVENRTMSDFEWRSPETYAKLQTAETAETADFAGECGRRASPCREEHLTPRYSEAIAAIGGISRGRWDSFMLSVNDVPSTHDIFHRFPAEGVTIRHAIVGGMIIVTGPIGRPASGAPQSLMAMTCRQKNRTVDEPAGRSRHRQAYRGRKLRPHAARFALSPRSVDIANGCVCLEA